MWIEIDRKIAQDLRDRCSIRGGRDLAKARGFSNWKAPPFEKGGINREAASCIKLCEFRGRQVCDKADAVCYGAVGGDGSNDLAVWIVHPSSQHQQRKRRTEFTVKPGPNLDQPDQVLAWFDAANMKHVVANEFGNLAPQLFVSAGPELILELMGQRIDDARRAPG